MKYRMVGIGEVLWDLLPGGKQLGGAPANFAFHAGELGAEARVVSRIGNDALGNEMLKQFAAIGVSAQCLETDPNAPTGTVTVQVGANGEPDYTIHEGVAWDNLEGETAAQKAVAEAEGVCFGTLAQRCEPSRATILRLLRLAPPEALKIFDLNLRQHYHSQRVIEDSLALATVLKLNETELPRLSEMLRLSGDPLTQLHELSKRYGLSTIAFTRGGNGSLLFSHGVWSDHPGIPAQVQDTVGAGDSFTAAMAFGLLAGWPLERVNHHANAVASFVASQPGATPALPETLSAPFRKAIAA